MHVGRVSPCHAARQPAPAPGLQTHCAQLAHAIVYLYLLPLRRRWSSCPRRRRRSSKSECRGLLRSGQASLAPDCWPCHAAACLRLPPSYASLPIPCRPLLKVCGRRGCGAAGQVWSDERAAGGAALVHAHLGGLSDAGGGEPIWRMWDACHACMVPACHGPGVTARPAAHGHSPTTELRERVQSRAMWPTNRCMHPPACCPACQESEYAAWVLVNGYALNHTTIAGGCRRGTHRQHPAGGALPARQRRAMLDAIALACRAAAGSQPQYRPPLVSFVCPAQCTAWRATPAA